MQYQARNNVTLVGTVSQFTNENNAPEFVICVNRLSGMQDKIPVAIHPDLAHIELRDGDEIALQGTFASHNVIVGDRSKLVLRVIANEIYNATEEDYTNPNLIELTGFICKTPIYRTTPFNREIADMLVAVNRQNTKSDYIPCIAWGKNARFCKTLLVGERILLSGRIQSREYQKRLDDATVETRTAYEVSINSISKEEEETQS